MIAATKESETDVRIVRLALSPEEHRAMRLAAAAGEVSMAKYARAAVKEKMERDSRGEGR